MVKMTKKKNWAPTYKKFDGKQFILQDQYKWKWMAKDNAKDLMSTRYVRVIEYAGEWALYKRCKKATRKDKWC